MKKMTFLFVIILLITTLFPSAALAASHTVADGQTLNLSTGELTLTADGTPVTTYVISDGDTISVAAGAAATITGSSNVLISCGAGVDLTLDAANIDLLSSIYECALSFSGDGTQPNTLTLVGNSVLKSGNAAGICVEGDTVLTIDGSGSVTAISGTNGAGIGGGVSGNGGTITIAGGTIIASGGYGGAGIGGGKRSGGTITITGGSITAQGGLGAAGIGGGLDQYYTCDITIEGGTVNATGGFDGPGIGSGRSGASAAVTISGGSVTAQGGNNSAGIGCGGTGSDANDITIQGGTVNATGGEGGEGIGGSSSNDTITISGGTVTATGGENAAGIGGGFMPDTITISGNADVTATGGNYGAGIGGGKEEDSGDIMIDSANVTATGGSGGAGIGGGNIGSGGTTTINSGFVTATGGTEAAGIGGGRPEDAGDEFLEGEGGIIIISGGIVCAKSGGGDDIGDGKYASGATLSILGNAGVLLANDTCVTPDTLHTHFDMTTITAGKIYGITTPAGWTQAAGYIILHTLEYDANGGSGTVPDDEVIHIGGSAVAPAAGDLTNGRLAMVQWNTDPDAKGIGYFPGVNIPVTEDITLYAIWRDRDVTSVLLDTHTLGLAHHDTDTLSATIDPTDATKNDVVWYSMDTDIAVVDQSGNVTAMGVGSTTVVAWADGVRDTCAVTVSKKPVMGVTLSSTSLAMMEGSTWGLTASVSPSDASNADISWTSSNTSIAAVNSNGNIIAVNHGSATITATADGVSASCAVTVNAQADDGDTGDDGTGDNDTGDHGTGDHGDTQEPVPDTGDHSTGGTADTPSADAADGTGGASSDTETQSSIASAAADVSADDSATQQPLTPPLFAWWWIPIGVLGVGAAALGVWVISLKRR